MSTDSDETRQRWVAISTGIWDDPLFPQERFSRREAMIYEVSVAAWKPRQVRTKDTIVELRRGEFLGARRHRSEKYGWSQKEVRGWDAMRERNGTITIRQPSGNLPNIIKLTNYDKYQFGDAAEGHQRAAAGQLAGQTLTKEIHRTTNRTCVRTNLDRFLQELRKSGQEAVAAVLLAPLSRLRSGKLPDPIGLLEDIADSVSGEPRAILVKAKSILLLTNEFLPSVATVAKAIEQAKSECSNLALSELKPGADGLIELERIKHPQWFYEWILWANVNPNEEAARNILVFIKGSHDCSTIRVPTARPPRSNVIELRRSGS